MGVTHDYRGLLNRALGRRSPIVDIEHMQLFSGASARTLFSSRGYVAVGGSSFRNAYRPSYWLRLAPIPAGLKTKVVGWLKGSWLDRRRLAVNVGNYMSWGFRQG